MEKKRCSCCKEVKDVSNFCRSKSRKDGYNVYCKECACIKSKIASEKTKRKEKIYNESDTKKCSKCGEIKSVKDFFKQKDKASGYMSQCKACHNEYKENRDFDYKAYKAEYYLDNKEQILINCKEWREDNKEKKAETDRIYAATHKEQIKARKERTKDRRREMSTKWSRRKLKTDPLFKLACYTRSLIGASFRRNGFNKDSRTAEILGCSWEFFYEYIERKFKEHPGMGWHNRHLWHLDHIICVSSGDTEEEIIKLNHYTNFQPLWAEDNLKKGSKMISDVQLKFM